MQLGTMRFLLLLIVLIDFTKATDYCTKKASTVFCDVTVSSEPIASYALIQRLGETEDTCLALLQKFDWPIGIYCPDLSFCGLGFDLDLDYSSFWDREAFLPANHTCVLIADTKIHSCDQVKDMLNVAGFFSRWWCDAGGAEQCLLERGTQCVQLQGNLKCFGCFPGYGADRDEEETFCTDIDECSLTTGICGTNGVCVNTVGSYYCRCHVGYISNSKSSSNGECIEEYSSWQPNLIYLPKSLVSFSDFLSSGSVDGQYNDENYKKCNIQNQLSTADKILLVIYDNEDNAREEIEFMGNSQAYTWFDTGNLLRSSLWNIEKSSPPIIFNFDSSGFEITTANDVTCENFGFLKVTCDIATECDQLKWWLEDASLQNRPCGIVYSKLNDAVNYNRAAWASKIQILTIPSSQQETSTWRRVFMLESFAGVDPYDFFVTGNAVNPRSSGVVHSEKLFRDEDIQKQIECAQFIKLQVYNFESTEVVSEVVFRGVEHFLNWFAFENVINSSLWDLPASNDDSPGMTTSIEGDYLRRFYINKRYGGCSGDFGWFTIVSVTETADPYCSWAQWWWKQSLLSKFSDSSQPTKDQPPYIIYAAASEAQFSLLWEDGGKMEIHVF